MTRFAPIRRPIGLAVVLVATIATACGDGITLPGAAAGYYRLVSVNGQPLPYLSPPSLGLVYHVTRGDLVLRRNRTFRHGLGGNIRFGHVVDGTYSLSDGELVLSEGPLGGSITGQVAGDSLTLTYFGPADNDMRFTYRRTQLTPTTLPSNRYRLLSINGRTGDPIVAYDTTIGDHRSVIYVDYDSLELSDGIFFRRHRSEAAIGYTNGQATTFSYSQWTMWGAYESAPGWVRLFHYSPPPSIPVRDSLAIAGDTLVRRTPLITGIQEDRYVRPR
ncbi:MAG TPA: hypothetical protein VJ650_11715 [Gemmatimonadaceae bacterium]|nr:hypothetical protein [Gemmatimonadaceae bacterium]